MRVFAAERSGAPQLYAPDGRFDTWLCSSSSSWRKTRLRSAGPLPSSPRALLPGDDIEMHGALRDFARQGQTCEDLVVSFAQALTACSTSRLTRTPFPGGGPGRRAGPGCPHPRTGPGLPTVRRALLGAGTSTTRWTVSCSGVLWRGASGKRNRSCHGRPGGGMNGTSEASRGRCGSKALRCVGRGTPPVIES